MKKIFVIVLTATFFISPIVATPAHAQYVDIVQSVKELPLDMIGWTIPKLVIQRMTGSTVKWINSGFEGKPAYLTNPEAHFTNMGDKLAAQFIFTQPGLNQLCGPLQAKIRLSLANNFSQDDSSKYTCTLTGVVDNIDNFMGDFSQGGWDGFFEITQKQQNNPIGAYLMAESDLTKKIAEKVNTKQKELDQGGGFMSFQQCEAELPPDSACMASCESAQTQGSTQSGCYSDCMLYASSASKEQLCSLSGSEMKTMTPGKVIADGLNKAVGAGTDGLVTADEINELVGALLNQLTNKIMGGVGGLFGSSGGGTSGSSSGSSGDSSITDQLTGTQETDTLTDYFGKTQALPDVPATPSTSTVVNVNIVGNTSSNLSFSPSSVQISNTSSSNTVVIYGGTSPYSMQTSPDSAVVTADLSGSNIGLTPVANGSTSLIIQDSSSPVQTATLQIEVTLP